MSRLPPAALCGAERQANGQDQCRPSEPDRPAQCAHGQSAGQYEAGLHRAQASSDARHAGDVAFTNHLGDQSDHRDSTTGSTYKVSNQYSHTYLDSNSHTILQTNPAYAPGPNTVWQELQPHN